VDLREHEDKILLLLALVISAVVGLIVVAFVAVTERMSRVLVNAGAIQRFLSSLVGGWLLFKYFPDARAAGSLRPGWRSSYEMASSMFAPSLGSLSALPSPWVVVWHSVAKAHRSISAPELHRRQADVWACARSRSNP